MRYLMVAVLAKNVLKSILESETGPFIFDTKNRRVLMSFLYFGVLEGVLM